MCFVFYQYNEYVASISMYSRTISIPNTHTQHSVYLKDRLNDEQRTYRYRYRLSRNVLFVKVVLASHQLTLSSIRYLSIASFCCTRDMFTKTIRIFTREMCDQVLRSIFCCTLFYKQILVVLFIECMVQSVSMCLFDLCCFLCQISVVYVI